MSVNEDAYPLPRATGEKAAETERLDGQHEMFKLAFGGIISAPLSPNVSSVLDLGCGTGIWSCQCAEMYPSAQVMGVDIVPPTAPPEGRLVPKNCTFVQANIEEQWHFAQSKSFDFVFARLLIAAIKDWPRLFSRVFEHLRPNGMFEIYEGVIGFRADDGTTEKDSAMMRWFDELGSFVGARGVNPDAPTAFTELLQNTGYKVIQDRSVKIYLDPDRGASHMPNGAQVALEISTDMRRMVNIMTEKALNSESQQRLAAEALEDLAKNSGRRGYYVYHTHRVVQKPE